MAITAGNVQSNLPQSTVKFYDKKFRENLKSQTPFVACAERLQLPVNSGNQYEMFMYVPMGANTSQVTEGVTLAGNQSISVLTTTATIGEYADFANFSSLSLATALDNTVENVAREMSYRLGESLSALVRATADGANSIDSSVLVQLAATTTSSFTALSLSQIRNSVQSLAGRAVRPMGDSALYAGVIHPFSLGDVLADNSNDSPIDILKHTPVGQAKMDELVSVDVTQTVELPASGVQFFQTNLVTQSNNYKSVAGLVGLRTYIFGRDGIFAINLGAKGDNSYGNGDWRNIECNIMQNVAPSVSDPEGLIPGWTSYRVHFTTSLGPDTTIRQRQIDAASAIS
jgi:hypothetical protein